MSLGGASPQKAAWFQMGLDTRQRQISGNETVQEKLAAVRDNLTGLSATNLPKLNFTELSLSIFQAQVSFAAAGERPQSSEMKSRCIRYSMATVVFLRRTKTSAYSIKKVRDHPVT